MSKKSLFFKGFKGEVGDIVRPEDCPFFRFKDSPRKRSDLWSRIKRSRYSLWSYNLWNGSASEGSKSCEGHGLSTTPHHFFFRKVARGLLTRRATFPDEESSLGILKSRREVIAKIFYQIYLTLQSHPLILPSASSRAIF